MAARTRQGAFPKTHMKKDNLWSPCQAGYKLVHGHRQASYGHPIDDFDATMSCFRVLMRRKYGVDIPFTGEDLPILMQCVKLSREMHVSNRDNADDGCGYWEAYALVKQERARRQQATQRRGQTPSQKGGARRAHCG